MAHVSGVQRNRHKDRVVAAYRRRYIDGWGFPAIAAELGVTVTHTVRLVNEGAQYCVSEELRDRARTTSLVELDALRTKAYEYLHGEYLFAQFGKIVLDENNKPLRDVGPNLAALDRILKIEKRRADIYGYDAPHRAVVNVITEDAVVAEINRLTKEMADADAESSAVDTT